MATSWHARPRTRDGSGLARRSAAREGGRIIVFRITYALEGAVLSADSPRDVTRLLARWRAGSPGAADELMASLYTELRRLAASYLRRERAGHTLQPTAVVNEAYLRLLPQREISWENRAHFFGIAAQMMRRVLVDYARRRRAGKRAGAVDDTVVMSSIAAPGPALDEVEVLALHEALDALAALDPRQAQIVEMKYFGGLTAEEIAEVLDISVSTVKREWTTAKVWLKHRMKQP